MAGDAPQRVRKTGWRLCSKKIAIHLNITKNDIILKCYKYAKILYQRFLFIAPTVAPDRRKARQKVVE